MDQSKEQWKAEFVRTFLATWCAVNYERSCIEGQQERLGNPPIEDAWCIAEEVYPKVWK